jgi:hypothetical protein
MFIRKSLNAGTKAAGFELFANWLISTKKPRKPAAPGVAPPAKPRATKVSFLALLFPRQRV